MTTMAVLPKVFQMCLVADECGKLGWVFPSELPDGDYVSPSFTIPWKTDQGQPEPKYAMAGSRKGKAVAWLLEWNKDQRVFSIECGLERPVGFALDFASSLEPTVYQPPVVLRPYLGNRLEFLGDDGRAGFIPIMPLDLHLMDKAYLTERITFVGETPEFPLPVLSTHSASL